MLLTSVSSDIAQANMKAMKESQSTNRPILRKTSSLASPNFIDEIRYYHVPIFWKLFSFIIIKYTKAVEKKKIEKKNQLTL